MNSDWLKIALEEMTPTKDNFKHEKLKQWQRWKILQRKVYKRDDYACLICKRKFNKKEIRDRAKSDPQHPLLTIDHIVRASGDRNKWWEMENLRTLCKPCHDRITERQSQEDFALVVMSRMFNDAGA